MGTINAAQLYGTYTKNLNLEGEIPPDSDLASGNPTSKNSGKTPALVYVVFILLLVSIRFLYEFAGD